MLDNYIPGFFGKLPILGDFVTRRLPNDFIACWDGWLQRAIASSKEELGDNWLKYYLTSPIWRFTLSSGICGPQAWAGVVMPSVDRVGRYFPLTIAISIEGFSSLALLTPAIESWFNKIEEIALSALERELSVADIEALLSTVDSSCWSSGGDTQQTLCEQSAGEFNAFFLQSQDGPASVNQNLQTLVNCITNSCFNGFSLWQTVGSTTVKPSLLFCEGLPPIHVFSGFLTGSLSDRGWRLHKAQVNDYEERDLDHSVLPAADEYDENSLLNSADGSLAYAVSCRSQSAINKGKRRQLNEDALLDRPEKGLWVVADGMGGHEAGDMASKLIVTSLDKLGPAVTLDHYLAQVKQCLIQVNGQLQELAMQRYEDQIIGSTVVALLAIDGRFACVWAGDSRLYRLRDKHLQQLTVDHCDESFYVDEQSQYGSFNTKQNNVITRAVGAYPELELDTIVVDSQPNDKFLLCSDGVDKELNRQEIETILNARPGNAADALMHAVLGTEARDNISIIVVEVIQNHSC